MPSFVSFPPDFIWGAATSSFQIEGSPLADGAAPSNWYEWTKTPGKIADGSDADLACDHYGRYAQDVQLMKDLGLMGYRFSLSWPRLVPERGRFNEKALDFYKRLLDELEKKCIAPNVTLFHWETPLWAKGGWENRETALAFGEYAEAALKKLGGRVSTWATHNEPVVTAQLGFLWGYFPPGKADRSVFATVVHHLNLSHGLALRAFREGRYQGEMGIVNALAPVRPATQKPEDILQADRIDVLQNRIFLDPLQGRGYPEFLFEYSKKPEGPWAEDLKVIAQPVDFLGVNHYFPLVGRHAPGVNLFDNDFRFEDGKPMNDLDWEIEPDALRRLLVRLWKDYGFKKILITENGIPTRDSLRTKEETIEDDLRVHYLGTYLAAAQKAIAEGVPLKGYYAWSLLDNFEWCHGYDPRFGLVHVDFKTQQRTLKKSAKWYQKTIAQKGFDLDALPKNPPYRVLGVEGKSNRSF
ncbi:MAG TPA: GH1 family beta-glucosidase [bacterium]|nr:GH1 family beta-glucosidase [bacterium]